MRQKLKISVRYIRVASRLGKHISSFTIFYLHIYTFICILILPLFLFYLKKIIFSVGIGIQSI